MRRDDRRLPTESGPITRIGRGGGVAVWEWRLQWTEETRCSLLAACLKRLCVWAFVRSSLCVLVERFFIGGEWTFGVGESTCEESVPWYVSTPSKRHVAFSVLQYDHVLRSAD
jgi:hypothetical protein